MHENKQTNLYSIVLLFIVIISISVPRYVGIERPITVDETTWLGFGSDFYYALGQRDFDLTIFETHPGVTTMISVATSIHILFPEYRGFGQGYFNIDQVSHDVPNMLKFYESHGIEPLSIMVLSRYIMATGSVIALIFCFFLSKNLFNLQIATLGILMVALDPFHIGHTRLIVQDGLMSSLVLMSLLAWFVYKKEDNRYYLLLSSIGAGLAIATKITSIYLFGFIFLFEIYDFWVTKKKNLKSHIIAFLGWGLLAIALLYIIWPAMWFDPLKTLAIPIFGSIGQYGQTGSDNSIFDSILQIDFRVLKSYAISLFGRTPLLTWFGMLLFIIFIFKQNQRSLLIKSKPFLIAIFFFPILFLLMFSIVSSSTYAHYILQSHIFVAYIGGLGFGLLVYWINENYNNNAKNIIFYGIFVGITLIQISQLLPEYPYFFTYRNQLASKNMSVNGYAAVLDLAADYLAEKPNAEKLSAHVWYGSGSFSFFFPGETTPIAPRNTWTSENFNRLQNFDYLVLYQGSFGRKSISILASKLENETPEKIISFNGTDFVWIYEVSEFSPSFFIVDN